MKLFTVVALVLMLALATECTRVSFELPDIEEKEVLVNYEAQSLGMTYEMEEGVAEDNCQKKLGLCIGAKGRAACILTCKAAGFLFARCQRKAPKFCVCTKPGPCMTMI